MRPPNTDTNLLSYHLGVLTKDGFIQKHDQSYTLSPKGLMYVDRFSEEKMSTCSQPKIISMLVVQNSDGDVLLQKRNKQPYIDTWTLPYGKLHIDDANIIEAAKREALEKLNITEDQPIHAGDAYIRVKNAKELLSTTLAHVFRFNRDDIVTNESTIWAKPHKLTNYNLAPAVEQIITRTFFKDDHFFEEFEVDWYN
ncbi:MAG TPA: NUDIX domain-containing protein [Candidatus Saccharibacteria bacterium]|nr:NUDIX domain-containing protein [Candidatus Saccharibacteria bacterium]